MQLFRAHTVASFMHPLFTGRRNRVPFLRASRCLGLPIESRPRTFGGRNLLILFQEDADRIAVRVANINQDIQHHGQPHLLVGEAGEGLVVKKSSWSCRRSRPRPCWHSYWSRSSGGASSRTPAGSGSPRSRKTFTGLPVSGPWIYRLRSVAAPVERSNWTPWGLCREFANLESPTAIVLENLKRHPAPLESRGATGAVPYLGYCSF